MQIITAARKTENRISQHAVGGENNAGAVTGSISVSDEIGPVTIYSQWENVSILDILLHFCLPHEQIYAMRSNLLQLRRLQPVTPDPS